MDVNDEAPNRPQKSIQENLEEAAEWIISSNTILILAGAGMGKDSGLSTYEEFGDQAIFQGYDYKSLASTDVMRNNYHIFSTWWTQCAIKYRETSSHEGYEILEKWCVGDNDDHHKKQKNHWVLTSNVDGHFRRFDFKHFTEIYGCTEEAIELVEKDENDQRTDSDNKGDLENDITKLNLKDDDHDQDINNTIKCCSEKREDKSFESDHRKKEVVISKMRPHVFLFNEDSDVIFQDYKEKWGIYQQWECTMENDPQTRLVVLEIGCGHRVPTLRREAAEVVVDFNNRFPGQGILIRINPGDKDGDKYILDNFRKGTYERTVWDKYMILFTHGGAKQVLMELDALISNKAKENNH